MRQILKYGIFTAVLFALALDSAALAELNSLTLPAGLDIIEEEAFMNDTSLEKITVPEGTTSIDSRAFAGSKVMEAELPASLSFIADDAFDGCEGLLVSAPEDSYAWRWAREKGFIPDEYVVGSIVTFGRYEQNNIFSDGEEDIEWIVLESDGRSLKLLSRYVLDAKPYNEESAYINWDGCTLRRWLNEDFLNAAFTPEEQALLDEAIEGTEDRVSILSRLELNRYSTALDHDTSAKATAYAVAKGGLILDDTTYCMWWLRAPNTWSSYAPFVTYSGYAVDLGGAEVNSRDYYVRPVISRRLS